MRIYRQVVANQLSEVEKPFAQRRPVTDSMSVLLFTLDPLERSHPEKLDPAEIRRCLKRSWLSRELVGPIDAVDVALRRQAARQATIETLLAAQAFRRDHGELPEHLSQLVPHYLEDLPLDPCHPTGAPLLYRRDEPAKAIIWSVGDDGLDSGAELTNSGKPHATRRRFCHQVRDCTIIFALAYTSASRQRGDPAAGHEAPFEAPSP